MNLWELTAGIRRQLAMPAFVFVTFCAGGLLAHVLDSCN